MLVLGQMFRCHETIYCRNLGDGASHQDRAGVCSACGIKSCSDPIQAGLQLPLQEPMQCIWNTHHLWHIWGCGPHDKLTLYRWHDPGDWRPVWRVQETQLLSCMRVWMDRMCKSCAHWVWTQSNYITTNKSTAWSYRQSVVARRFLCLYAGVYVQSKNINNISGRHHCPWNWEGGTFLRLTSWNLSVACRYCQWFQMTKTMLSNPGWWLLPYSMNCHEKITLLL